MAWPVGIFVAIVIIVLMINNPAFRVVVLGLVFLIIAGVYILYAHDADKKQRRLSAISPSEIEIRDSTLKYNYGYTFAAIAKNNSKSFNLRRINVLVSAYDCPETDPTDRTRCEAIGEDTISISSSIPAGHIRQINGLVSFGDMPPIKGRFVWNYRIEQVEAN